jgi:hypothetical protein
MTSRVENPSKIRLTAFCIIVACGMAHSVQARIIYCAHGAGYIRVGMTENQVLSMCGQPTSIKTSHQPATHKVDMTQLIYTTVAQTNPYPGLQNAVYTKWSLPSGLQSAFSYQISLIKNKVVAVQINGANGNAIDICGGNKIQVGDELSDVISMCGTPNATNTTYINQPIPGTLKNETWTYQFDYQPPFDLTFINGSLESID